MLKKVRSPAADRYRVPAAIALTVGGVFGFMPILGFWMTPLGLGLLAIDVPVMRPMIPPWVTTSSFTLSSFSMFWSSLAFFGSYV